MAGLTDRYLDELGSLLAFDPALAARMREEIAGHVEDALAGLDAPTEADERRVLTRLGPPGDMVRRFLIDGLDRQAERVWWALLAALSATFLAMRLRTLGLEAPSAGPDLAALIDRYGFVVALLLGPAGWVMARRIGMAEGLDRAAAQRLSLIAALGVLSLGALGAAITAGAVRLWVQPPGDLPQTVLFAGLFLEAGLVWICGRQVGGLVRRTLIARALAAT